MTRSAAPVAERGSAPETSAPTGCPMVAGIYLKANGELPCWCQVGEQKILETVDREWLERPDSDLLGHPELQTIRQAFAAGELPYPDLCRRCTALGAGTTDGSRPEHLVQVLVEPSYLCQLDCPACIAPKVRLATKQPPYYLDPDLFRAFLDRLRADGVRSVGTFHFEGRGDPLLNRHLGTLVRLARGAFPGAKTQVTTHGSYPFASWLLDGDLDALQVSVDGARPESYGRYRRGGDLDRVFALMRAIRDGRRRADSRLVVVWKYILFEWNDSDEEMALAGRLADELEAQLVWVLTDSVGKSQRFPDLASVADRLLELAPRSSVRVATDLAGSQRLDGRWEGDAAQALRVYEGLIRTVGERDVALFPRRLAAALAVDPGLDDATVARWVAEALEDDWLSPDRVEELIEGLRFPSSLGSLASIAFDTGRWGAATQLFTTYLARGPEAPNRAQVEERLLLAVIRHHLGSDDPAHFFEQPPDVLAATDEALLQVDPGRLPGDNWAQADEPVTTWLDAITLPETRRLLGYVRWARGRLDDAAELFRAYLATAPTKANTEPVTWALGQLDAEKAKSA